MSTLVKIALVLTVALLAASPAGAVTEPKTGTEYPDTLGVEVDGETILLTATGAGLREKTFLKVDVYSIVSYLDCEVEPGDDAARTVLTSDAPKRIQMDLRRSFGRDKLVDTFRDVIGKNYDDTSAFADDLQTFLAYFDRDAQEGDRLVFDYHPGRGLTTILNGEVKGVIDNPEFAQALWTVWFGEKPADKGLRRDLTAQFAR
ncbi:MAG: chalcone isomerase family protein [Candidatus Krumholzibacteriia bacterium]